MLVQALAIGCLAWSAGCHTGAGSGPAGRIEHAGILAGFPGGTEAGPGRKLFFEPSAVIRNGEAALIANDKPIPGESPVLSVPIREFDKSYVDSSAVTYLRIAAFQNASKIESFAASTSWSFAATDFEGITADPQEDTFNNLLAWPNGKPELARILSPSERAGVASSKELRPSLAAALKSATYPEGPPYYKIEGLASPDSKSLLFGVREIGTNYEHPEYCFIILQTALVADSATGIGVSRNFTKLLEFRPVIPERPNIRLGLSSLEYDPELGAFCALTSYEDGGNLGAYLWVFTLKDLARHSPPRLVRTSSGRPLAFSHKAEGLMPLGKRRYLIVCDDDRELKPIETSGGIHVRQPHEAAFFIVSLGALQ